MIKLRRRLLIKLRLRLLSPCPSLDQNQDTQISVDACDVVEEESYFIEDTASAPWKATLKINDCDITWKLDSGADTSVISHDEWQKMSPRPKLVRSSANIGSPGGKLDVIGQFTGKCRFRDTSYRWRIHVVRNKTNNLLARAVSERLGLISRVDANVFGESGLFKCKPVHISLADNVEPYNLSVPRRIPFAIMPKVKEEIDRMVNIGVIEKVEQPTDWCSGIVVVPKKSGQVRICVDLKKLNKCVKRERYVIPTPEDILGKMKDARFFSRLDASSGFWQIPLDNESKLLTTFITPWGRYCMTRLPFGISSAPEIFQSKMSDLVRDIEGVNVYMDDIVIYASTVEEHDSILDKVLSVIEESGLKLNKSKCTFCQTEIELLGFKVNSQGVSPSDEKVRAIVDMPYPSNVTELKRFLGSVNFLGRFLPNLSNVAQPLNELLRSDRCWIFDSVQKQAYNDVKKLVSSNQVLAFYDPNKETRITSDASSYGLGGALWQLHDQVWKPVTFCSRSLSEAERKYAQIEKECLSVVWTCERLQRYLVGLNFCALTDHKPLIPLINQKDLDATPVRCQRLLMRLMRFNVEAKYVPGKSLYVADTLSRAPLPETSLPGDTLESDVKVYVDAIIENLPASESKLEIIQRETNLDPELQVVKSYILNGWPTYSCDVKLCAKPYFAYRDTLSYTNNLILHGNRIVIPESLRVDMLNRVHEGHLGIVKCRERVRSCIWWPGIGAQIQNVVQNCAHCQITRPKHHKEPLLPSELPTRPWMKIATDLCDESGSTYLIVCDYFSRFIEIMKMGKITTSEVVKRLKGLFARHGIPEILVSDNGPQYSSVEFKQFCKQYDISHMTSSPHFPSSNGEAERAVQTAKQILKQSDPDLALLSYHSTPIGPTHLSPAELLMSRKFRTTLPILPESLQPKVQNYDSVKEKDDSAKSRYKKFYDKRYSARNLEPVKSGDNVRIKLDNEKRWSDPATVLGSHPDMPRSYYVQTSDGTIYRRNRRHLQQTDYGLKPPMPINMDSGSDTPNSDNAKPVSKTPVKDNSFLCLLVLAKRPMDKLKDHHQLNLQKGDTQLETEKPQ